MKKALLIIGMIVIFFAGCRKDDVLEASKVEMKDVTMERGWEHVKMSGEYSYPQALEGMKILVSSNENMGESVEYVCALDDMKFDVTIDNLEAGATYYYRYEYDNGYDKVKGDKENFVTVGKPIVVTKDVGGITKSSAVLSGSVTNNDAANKIKERGFCWGKNPNPTISGSHNNNGSSSGTGTTGFSYNLTNLTSGTKYYVRTYIVTDFGTLYGEEKSFVTTGEEPEITLPTVTTNSVSNITSNSAACGGDVTSDGNGTVTARGVCWSETSEPKINNLYSEESNDGTGTGSFTSSLTNLKANTKYYVRAYAINEAGTVYGEVKSFVTETISGTENGHDYVDLGLPSGLKWATCNVGANSLESYGNYYAWGEISTKVTYLTTNSLTYEKNMNDISGNAKYDAATANWGGNWRMPTRDELNELRNNCTWTWTTQNGVNGYKVTSKTNGGSIFMPAAGSKNSSFVGVGERGEYWTSTPSDNDGEAIFLRFEESFYYIVECARSWGQCIRPVFGGNFEGPGEQPEEPEIVLPTVTTSDVTNITSNSATCGGNVTSDGNGTVTARGVCWSTSQNPTINNNRSIDGIGTGNFTSNLSNLVPQTTYYVRAYATNEAGTSYGEVKSFTTLGDEPEDTYEETISGTENGHNYVDLGLPSGLKWATCNVGASSSEEYGDYYAWGETTTKSEYTVDNSLTYGLSDYELQSKGYIDGEGNLTAQYDAATANWSGNWRMPTKSEMQELIDNCTWEWMTQNGILGHKVEGPNGNNIFLPAAGYCDMSMLCDDGNIGDYWSSTPNEYNDYYAYPLYFNNSNQSMGFSSQSYGLSIRPVFGGDFEEPEQPETPSANQTFNVNGVTFTMIAVEGDTFQMGATSEQGSDVNSDEKPVHNVTLSDYYIGETEVTQELWEAVVGSNPSKFSGYPQRPVEYVSWNDCQEFITKLSQLTGKNFRLPTEAEWEYAARGGNRSKRYKYSGSNTIGDVAWYTDNSSSRTHDVKTKQANGLGIYDMSGNVYEWCQDWYGDYSSSPENNPTGPATGSDRVLRGGSWDYGEWSCRVSCRLGRNPAGWSNSYGFRLAL